MVFHVLKYFTPLLIGNSIVTATSDNGVGGDVKVLGDKVGLMDMASIDVSGQIGGGTILIGGDQQGLNPDVQNATFTYVGQDATVKADAIEDGDGGKVIVYAEDTARIYGQLSARAGAIGGDGGFIETSGKQGFQITRTPDIRAPNGQGGTWLIDPRDIDIVSGGGNSNINTTSPFIPTGNNATLGVDLIEGALTPNSTVLVTTSGSGSQNGVIDWTGSATLNLSESNIGAGNIATLTLHAADDIIIDGTIGGTVSGFASDGEDELCKTMLLPWTELPP